MSTMRDELCERFTKFIIVPRILSLTLIVIPILVYMCPSVLHTDSLSLVKVSPSKNNTNTTDAPSLFVGVSGIMT